MNVLCVDTSTRHNWVALFKDGEMIACASYQDRQSCLINLMPTIEIVLKNAATKLTDLKCIVTVIGPGAWSSLRIGLATVKQLCLVNQIPLFTFNNLDLLATLALQTHHAEYVLAAMDAQNNHAYAALYHIENGQPTLVTPYLWEDVAKVVSHIPTEADSVLIVGDAAHLFSPHLHPTWQNEIFIPAQGSRYLALLAELAETEKPDFDREAIILTKPLYIQPSSAEVEFKVTVT